MQTQTVVDIRQFMQQYFDAWEESVPEKILPYYTDEVVLDVLGFAALLEGKQAVAEHFVLPVTKAFPGNVHQIRNLIHQGNQVVIEWMFVAVHKGDFAGIPATGRTVNVPGCSVYTVDGLQITHGRIYFNSPTLMQPLGAAR